MKKIIFISLLLFVKCISINQFKKNDDYKYPAFYKGVYLNISPTVNFEIFKNQINTLKFYGLNTVVLDSYNEQYMFKPEYIYYCRKSNVHAITRIIMFPGGLRTCYAQQKYIDAKMRLINKACISGYKEIQLDYIRYADRKTYMSNRDKAKYIESIVNQIKTICNKYNVKLAVDVFGRIPFTRNDRIGQRMNLKKYADIICPMAYPSYYGRQASKNEYSLLKTVIKKSRSVAPSVKIVLWVQGFKHVSITKSFYWFVNNQIRAVKDAGGDGFIMWNAGRDYGTLFAVMQNFNVRETT
jgi:hypothetical protein